MIDAGDVHLADLNDEHRRRVLVVSNARFTAASGRAIVVPEIVGPPDEVSDPWRIECEGVVFALDFVRALPVERLLQRTGRIDSTSLATTRRALRNIT
jgi:mRNA-degrading endonuclease toxin of MazEF toxin-antitoxin module